MTTKYVNYRLTECVNCSEGPSVKRGASNTCTRSAKKIRICMAFDEQEKKIEQKASEKRSDVKMVDIEKYQKKINDALEKSLSEMPLLNERDKLLYKLAFNVGVNTGVTLFQEGP